ncbi:winged helix-turn-helix domain-containing protein [Streptomyces sp. NBC_00210]|uniref:helix-turn-helix domain-containing protein n=1 Tax=Streptomyces sp. NBC_00210 TaxID=2903636 RepID=UPI00386BCF0B
MSLSVRRVWELQRRQGWSCQQPVRRAVERDDVAVAGWVKETWLQAKPPRRRSGRGSSSSCAVRRCVSCGGERPSLLTCRGREVELRAAWVMPGRAGAALTKPGCASTARWCGSGERDGEEYARSRRLYLS